MFILNCDPDQGFISSETNITYKFGLDKEKCLEKIGKFDNEYAHFVSNFEDILSNYPLNENENENENENSLSRLNNNRNNNPSQLDHIFERLNSCILNLYLFNFIS